MEFILAKLNKHLIESISLFKTVDQGGHGHPWREISIGERMVGRFCNKMSLAQINLVYH